MKNTRLEAVDAWKPARELSRQVPAATRARAFDVERDLRRQIKRAATSIMANIAEGFDAGSDPEFRRFLRIARRSASEVQSHLYTALDQNLLDAKSFQSLYGSAVEVKRLIGGFIRYLNQERPKTKDLGPRT